MLAHARRGRPWAAGALASGWKSKPRSACSLSMASTLPRSDAALTCSLRSFPSTTTSGSKPSGGGSSGGLMAASDAWAPRAETGAMGRVETDSRRLAVRQCRAECRAPKGGAGWEGIQDAGNSHVRKAALLHVRLPPVDSVACLFIWYNASAVRVSVRLRSSFHACQTSSAASARPRRTARFASEISRERRQYHGKR